MHSSNCCIFVPSPSKPLPFIYPRTNYKQTKQINFQLVIYNLFEVGNVKYFKQSKRVVKRLLLKTTLSLIYIYTKQTKTYPSTLIIKLITIFAKKRCIIWLIVLLRTFITIMYKWGKLHSTFCRLQGEALKTY